MCGEHSCCCLLEVNFCECRSSEHTPALLWTWCSVVPRKVFWTDTLTTAGGVHQTGDSPSFIPPLNMSLPSHCFFELSVHSHCPLVKLGCLFFFSWLPTGFLNLSIVGIFELDHSGVQLFWALGGVGQHLHARSTFPPPVMTAANIPTWISPSVPWGTESPLVEKQCFIITLSILGLLAPFCVTLFFLSFLFIFQLYFWCVIP